MAITVGRRPGGSARDEERRPRGEGTRGSRYRSESRDEDDSPRRAARSRRDEDDGSRGRGRSRRDEPEAEPPRSRFRRGGSDEDEGHGSRSRSRRSGGDDDQQGLQRTAQRGWSGSKRVREETSDYGDRFSLPEDDFVLIGFLEDEPFDSVGRHYIQEFRGRKQFICPGKKGPYECPLCKYGDKANPMSYFNIVVFDEDEGPIAKVWAVGPGYAKDIETEQNSRAVGGKLSSCYFEVKAVKSDSGKGAPKLKINRVSEREVEDVWNTDLPSDDEWEALYKECKGDGYVKFDPKRVLEDAVDQLDRMGD